MRQTIKIILFVVAFFVNARLVSANNYYSSLITTEKGVLLGEMDDRVWFNPLNAIYLSEDLGETWKSIGLENRGVLDVHYHNGVIYASTFYVIENKLGLYVSKDFGKTWENKISKFSTTKVSADDNAIYLGAVHCGLWVSFDEGVSWEQKVGNDCSQREIKEIYSNENITYVAVSGNVYKTTDGGQSFSVDTFLSFKSIYSFAEDDKYIYAGSSSKWGLHRRLKSEETWEKVASSNIYSLHSSNNILYASVGLNQNGKYNIISSPDHGVSWETMGEINNWTNAITTVVGDKTYALAQVWGDGVRKFPYQTGFYLDQFLNPPWETSGSWELVDKITAYFDHSYPLLGYSSHTEPDTEKETTLSFIGLKEKEPNIYYSSHSGTDFHLEYGTPIKAVFGGIATYTTCGGCGHTIKIDHLNGYTSIYMHLQEEGLITKSGTVNVSLGETIGKVGMTGNTSGPHLHFEVQKNDKSFPEKRVDPFGWQSGSLKDPWASYTWKDNYGDHLGSVSKYLWVNEIIQNYTHTSESTCLSSDNKQVCFGEPPDSSPLNITLRPHIRPLNVDRLRYVPNTSLLVTATNILGEDTKVFDNPLLFTFRYTKELIGDVLEDSLSIYFKDDASGNWIKIPSVVDLVNKTVKAYVSHLTWFALFGETEILEEPKTVLIATGTQENGWYSNSVTIELSSNKTAYYSIGKEDLWSEYENPVVIDNSGIYLFRFRSLNNESGKVEQTQEQIFKVKGERWATQSVVRGSIFRVNIQ